MAYQLFISKKIKKNLSKIDVRFLPRILVALVAIERDPFIGKPLEGRLAGNFSYRVWPYRILYIIKRHELLIVIINIGHRQGSYK